MTEIRVLSGGAAAGVVKGIQEDFENTNQCKINGTFSAVGAMRDLVLQGEACDLVILSKSLVDELVNSGHVDPNSVRSLGIVPTGIAIPSKRTSPSPKISTVDELKEAFRSAPALYFPDMEKSTAGIHFMKVMKTLGLDQELATRFKTFPNGATAMAQMALDPDTNVIGGTQTTEINICSGVDLIGLLPQELELNTDYTLGICKNSKNSVLAKNLADVLVGQDSLVIRKRIGYLI
ncbi:molybdate ABC transporter substrate-binding protein [Polynucleobacter sp. SHI8]|uniref:molybdate ABC transporter substrate-binding protein n=1 Tax=unclassified Polynucleobacter TaxID=2640945 RepID=UPI0024932667|nr:MULTISPECIES: substrate-binding domain-containing protein [unclassified Polynucleobacter]BDW11132.1 molybdate ABC transporter substrate-binding protein [Polynucleobacter sp. SHI2]BDW13578.1 molybdate ABC transporter substrate-binding protein [Polynucleobacter sp. SHI8]